MGAQSVLKARLVCEEVKGKQVLVRWGCSRGGSQQEGRSKEGSKEKVVWQGMGKNESRHRRDLPLQCLSLSSTYWAVFSSSSFPLF